MNKKLEILKNRKGVLYDVVGDSVSSTISFPCGCEVEISWINIFSGHIKEMYFLNICENHDATTNGEGLSWNEILEGKTNNEKD